MEKCRYKIGDRIFYEQFDIVPGHGVKVVGIGSNIVTDIKPSSYIDYDGNTVEFYFLELGTGCVIEDYNCIPYDDPRVEKEIEKYKEHDEQVEELFIWASDKWNIPYDEVKKHIKWLLSSGDDDE